MGFDSPWHWIIVVIVLAALFGYKKLPDMSRSVARSLRIFKTEMKGLSEDDAARRDHTGSSSPYGDNPYAGGPASAAPTPMTQPAAPVQSLPAQPSVAQPSAAQPSAAQPSTSQPSAGQSPVTSAPSVTPAVAPITEPRSSAPPSGN
jgi:sec-independent protein translocase protein TatA